MFLFEFPNKFFLTITGVLFLYFFNVSALFSQPNTIFGLSLWLRSDSGITLNGSEVSSWNDMSGNNNHAIQNDPASQPKWVTNIDMLADNSALRFDGNDFLTINSSSVVGSIFVVFNWNGALSNYPINIGILTQQVFTSNTVALGVKGSSTNLYDVQADISFNISDYKINNVQTINSSPIENYKIASAVTSSNPVTFADFIVGRLCQFPSYLTGDIAEIILYDHPLNQVEHDEVFNYLKNKYAPPVNLGSDIVLKNFCDTVLSAPKHFIDYLWSTGSTADSIIISTPGKYWLTVTDVFGLQSLDTIEFSYNYNINQIADTILCPGQTLLWNTNLDKTSFTFIWPDLSSDSLLNINQASQYWVNVTDTFGCSLTSDTIDVVFDNIQQQISLGSDTVLCQGNVIKLIQGESLVQSYIWNDNSNLPYFEIMNAGQYWVQVSSNNDCIASDTINVTIQGIAPEALFSFSNVCLGDSMRFIDGSVPPSGETIELWNWDFGDGNLSIDKNPVHFFNAPGNYLVKLVATTATGCQDEYLQTVMVHYLPKVGFSSPLACSGFEVQFTDTSSALNNTVVQWNWNFGNAPSGLENFSNDQNPFHAYQLPGVYNVKLIVTTLFGCVDSTIKPIVVYESPIADFTFQSVCSGTPIDFINNSSLTLPSIISSYNWDFGNTASSSANPSFLFDAPGMHNVSLVVSANNGCVSEIQKAVEVYHKPTAWFEPVDVCVNSAVEFKDLSIIADNSINSWIWNFNDLQSFSIKNPIVNFEEVDVYFVSLKVNTINECKDSVVRVVKIHPLPIPLFTIEPQVVIPGQPMKLKNLSNGAQNYSWGLGDGTSSNLIDLEHTYSFENTYQIILSAQSQYGCNQSFSRTLNVITANLDIAVTNIFVITKGNYLNITAELTNYGTVAIQEIDLILEQKNGRRIKELWTGDFHSGKKLLYEFKAEINPLNENIQDYVCVLALNPNKSNDTNFENNEYCKLLGNNDLVLMDPFPNPVNDQLTIRFFLPVASEIKLEILNHQGKMINSNLPNTGSKGINTLYFNANSLQAGSYTIKLTYNGQVFTRKFIKGDN
ncbi:MAG: PKD domain-containing protein [Bacteroidetes bacterium]|nr:PKD domain-containing protein [Bacteroidota bacterium]HET6244009.1 PKD domain-containing protein [Bacteroidia bacterium]